jgi:hypothetical protein
MNGIYYQGTTEEEKRNSYAAIIEENNILKQQLTEAKCDADEFEQVAVNHINENENLRKQIVMLQDAIKTLVDDYTDRFDMDSSSTNPGMKCAVKQGQEALAATQDLSGAVRCGACGMALRGERY